jgi:superfamily II DNA or RNA helicase
VFSRYTEQANTINNNTYHSKNSKDENEKIFDLFNSGKIRCMSVCSKIDRGDNIVGLNNIILESYTSSDTIIRQRIGRSNRLDVNDIANIFILLPYFMRKNADGTYTQAATQAVKWADTMLMEYDLSKAKIYDYRSIKSNL